MSNAVEESTRRIERLRESIHKGLLLLHEWATYQDLYVSGFIPDGTSETVAKTIIEDEKQGIFGDAE